MERLVGTSEEEEEEEMEMEVKGEDEGRGNQGFYSQEQEEKIGARRSRPKEEKERTKLRERHRRAITARILAGLRKHGNYNLRVRADINDVIAALAREAGWVVLPDGTTHPSRQVLSSSSSSTSSCCCCCCFERHLDVLINGTGEKIEEFLVAQEMLPFVCTGVLVGGGVH
ncbi:hypothetical protein AAC387_Pa11g0278 [Persea americana]